MTRLIRTATMLTVGVGGLLIASAALAFVPDPTNSIKSSACLVLVGDNGTVAAPTVTNTIPALWTVQVKDNAPTPNVVPFALVRIDFTNCQSIHVATQASQKGPYTLTVDPNIKSVSTTADGSGIARFIVEGGADGNLYTGIGVPGGQATISANGYPLGNLTVTALNRNLTLAGGSNPVNATDGSVLLAMLVPVPQPYKSHADLNCDGVSNAADASVILQHVVLPAFPGRSNVCPPGVIAPNANPGYAW